MLDKMMEELKPCPFCGGKARSVMAHFDGQNTVKVFCKNCGATITSSEGSLQDIITTWNSRIEKVRLINADELLHRLSEYEKEIIDTYGDNDEYVKCLYHVKEIIESIPLEVDFIRKSVALSYPFANGQYDKEHADKHFILGCKSYREWLENLN